MKYSLRTKLSLSYVFISLLLVFVISIFANVFLDKQFQNYIIRQQKLKSDELISLVSQQYLGDDIWDIVAIENIGISALENGMILTTSS